MVVFSILEPGHSELLHQPVKAGAPEGPGGEGTGDEARRIRDGPNAIAVCLFIGAWSAVGAAYATRRMRVGS